MNLDNARILVVGAGLMGAGIAQVAAQAGHDVALFDTRDGAAAAAKAKLAATLDGLVARASSPPRPPPPRWPASRPWPRCAGRPRHRGHRREPGHQARAVRRAGGAAADDAVIATNTSSISVTALARGMKRPERLVGMHFFNPVPLMKLVEVVWGLGTAPAVAQAMFDLAGRWGKTAVHTRSTPGFIVNRIARPYYAEALMLLQERAAAPEVIDACLRAAGFRMGPCELMDLIGHDTNFAVTNSVFAANFFDRRFTPSLVQQELVDAGFLGARAGGLLPLPRGRAGAAAAGSYPTPRQAWSCMAGRRRRPAAALPDVERQASDWVGLEADRLQLRLTDGRTARSRRCATSRRRWWCSTCRWATRRPGLCQVRQLRHTWLAARAGFTRGGGHAGPGRRANDRHAGQRGRRCRAAGRLRRGRRRRGHEAGRQLPRRPVRVAARWGVAPSSVAGPPGCHYRGERYRVSPYPRP
jgi:3-hydroxybutyryl-CoA dehydrogenase